MQFGIFSVGDIAPDPVSGYTQSEAERIKNIARGDNLSGTSPYQDSDPGIEAHFPVAL